MSFTKMSMREFTGRGPGSTIRLPRSASMNEAADTAAGLRIKRQTLYHRLHRIEEALGADLDDGETRLAVHLALRADRYLDLTSKP